MLNNWKLYLPLLFAMGLVFAGSGGEGLDYSNPMETSCPGNGGIVDFTCNIMKTLLILGPMLAVMALVVGGITYVYANVFVTADQRGKYHTLATNLALGGLILAAIVGGAGIIVNAGMQFFTAG